MVRVANPLVLFDLKVDSKTSQNPRDVEVQVQFNLDEDCKRSLNPGVVDDQFNLTLKYRTC